MIKVFGMLTDVIVQKLDKRVRNLFVKYTSTCGNDFNSSEHEMEFRMENHLKRKWIQRI